MKIGKNGILEDDNGEQIKDAAGNAINVQELFDQALNTRMGRERSDKDKLTQRINELQGELDKAIKPEVKADLETRLEELQRQLETKEQTAQRQFKTEMDKAKNQLTQLQAERDQYLGQYREAVIGQQIAHAAVEHGFKKPDYLRMQLLDKMEWVDEVGGDGKPTGKQVPRFKFMVAPKEGAAPEETLMEIKDAAAYVAKAEPDLVLGTGTTGSGNNGRPASGGGSQPEGLSGIYTSMK
jgi:AraC-like DNA-binding protein